MPVGVFVRRNGFASLRWPHLAADESQEPLVDPMAAANVLRDEDSSVVAEADSPAVESLVVKRAQGEAVVGGVGTSCGVPLDVRSFDAEIGSLELSVIATDGAPVFVDPDGCHVHHCTIMGGWVPRSECTIVMGASQRLVGAGQVQKSS